MRFLRHDGIYRSDVSLLLINPVQMLASRWSAPLPGYSGRAGRNLHVLPIVRDEFRPANPRSGWSPPEPVSASPASPE